MAILKKRRAKDAPAPVTAGKQTTAQTPSERLTSAIKGEAVATPQLGGRTAVTPARTAAAPKPAISQPGGATSITNRVTGATRPTVSTTQGRGASGSGLTNAITGALSGAAIGVGAKAVYDKLSGKVRTVPASTPAAGGATASRPGGATAGGARPPAGGTAGGARPGGVTPPFAPPGTNRPPAAGGATSGGSRSPGGGARPPAGGATAGDTTTSEGGNTTYTYDDGSTITVDANGNVVSTTEATDVFGRGETTTDSSGNTVYTYDDGSTITLDANGNIVSSTEATADSVAQSGDQSGDQFVESGQYQDSDGNIYDAEGNLLYAADTTGGDYWTDQAIADYVYTDQNGNQYDYYGNLISEGNYADSSFNWEDFYANNESSGNDQYAGNDYEDYFYPEEDYAYNQYSGDDSDWWAKKGGLVALMNKGGGVRHFDDGGYSSTREEVQDWQNVNYNYGEMGDPGSMAGDFTLHPGGAGRNTYTTYDPIPQGGRPQYFDDGSKIIQYADGSYLIFDSDGELYQAAANGVENSEAERYIDFILEDTGPATGGDSETQGPFGDWEESYTDRFLPGNTRPSLPVATSPAPGGAPAVTPSAGPATTAAGPATTTSAGGLNRYSAGNIQYFDDGSYIQTFDDGSTLTVDSDGNVFRATEAPDYSVRAQGSGEGRTSYYNPVSAADAARQRVQDAQRQEAQSSAIGDIIDKITGSGYLGAGAAGAVLGALLGNTDLFSGGSGTQNQGIDMSKVGVIPARTTDFGVGPANYVTYDQYGARQEMPDIYGNELYRNLNAPGFNPVNEGEYGDQSPDVATPAMADGGLADSYYTFGKTVDPLKNLRNPRPMPQSGGLPQAMPQAMPQQGMKSGGLPALSNVPLAEGRLDFRQGSAVHGPGDGQSDDIPAMLADGEYVIDAETVAQIGNGSTKAGAKALDEFRQNIRKHKRSAPLDKIPPKTKALTSYLKKGN